MSKTARPDRKKNDRRRKKEPGEYEETTLSVDRVTRVVAGGRRMRFRSVVVIGDKKGKVGLGTGKANDVQSSVQKATSDAKRHMIRVPIIDGTIPHEIDTKFKAARIRLLPAREGTGVIAGGALRVVLEHAGVKNVLSKRYGTTNKLVNAQAVMKALGDLRGSSIVDPNAPKDAKKDAEIETQEAERSGLTVKEVSKKDVDADGTLKKGK